MTWNEMSDADRRMWALGQAGVALRCGAGDVAAAIADASKLVDFINGLETAAEPTPSPYQGVDQELVT